MIISSFLFSIRVLLKEHPFEFLTPMIILLWVVTAIMMLAVERVVPGASIKRYDDAFWVAIITMSTVGYGDMSPITMFGRVWCVIGGVAGGTLVVTLITAVFITMTDPAWNETEVIHVLKFKSWEKKMRGLMCSAIQRAWRLHSFIDKIPGYHNPRLKATVDDAMTKAASSSEGPLALVEEGTGGGVEMSDIGSKTSSALSGATTNAMMVSPVDLVPHVWESERLSIRPGPLHHIEGMSFGERIKLKTLRWLLFEAVDELRWHRFHKPRACAAQQHCSVLSLLLSLSLSLSLSFFLLAGWHPLGNTHSWSTHCTTRVPLYYSRHRTAGAWARGGCGESHGLNRWSVVGDRSPMVVSEASNKVKP